MTVTYLLLRKRHASVGDLVLEQASDILRYSEDYGRSANLGIKDLFAEMTEEEGLDQRIQTQEMNSDDEAITDVPNDNDHELFEATWK